MGGSLYFSAYSSSNGYELWKSDGTTAGTVELKNIASGSSSSYPKHLTVVQGRLFFSAGTGSQGTELWVSDGTSAGTVLFADIAFGSASSSPQFLRVVGSRLFFSADNGTAGRELWVSDGTLNGTRLTRDLTPGTGSTLRDGYDFEGVAVGSELFFVTSLNMYRSDGTGGGTLMVIDTSAPGRFPRDLAVLGGRLYFIADGVTGNDLWKTDGTVEGTSRVADLDAGDTGSAPTHFLAVDGSLFFLSQEQITGTFWKSDGTPAGTRPLHLVPKPSLFDKIPMINLGSTIFYIGWFTETGAELCSTDGTQESIRVVKDIRPGTGSSSISALTVVGGNRFFFTANDGVRDQELWVSDGTSAGTTLVKDISAGGGPSFLSNHKLVAVGNAVYFVPFTGELGFELWRSDGTEAGTFVVKDIGGFASSEPADVTAVNDMAYFTAFLDTTGRELWRTDGTAEGTIQLGDLRPGRASANPGNLTAVGNVLFFTVDDGTSGEELWISNGTTVGTRRVKDIAPGAQGSAPRALTALGSVLFFTAADGVGGYELWKSDGTEAGTVKVKELRPGPLGGVAHTPMFAVPSRGVVVFAATDGETGVELWETDGTEAGTQRVADIAEGPASAFPEQFALAGSNLFFSAEDGVHGRELWRVRLASINDRTPPTITCPSSVTAEATSAQGGPATFTAQATDEGSTAVVDYSQASGTAFPFGATTVTATARDIRGNTAQCSFQVTVRDTSAPIVTCPASVTLDATGPTGTLVTYDAARATDAVTPAPELTYSQPSDSVFPIGSTQVTVTARDAAGNQAQCRFNVSVLAQEEEGSGCGCSTRTSAAGGASWGALLVLCWAVSRLGRRQGHKEP
jgi:ELWxxDGT repeat protein